MRHRDGQIWIDPQAADAAFTGSASFLVRQLAPAAGLPTLDACLLRRCVVGTAASWSPGLDAAGLEFSWDFGDGSSLAVRRQQRREPHLRQRRASTSSR